ncbi:sigma-70 family RNA polymerase sigma factor [Thalassotalea crassostreae]|uniref:sigma-70 family RNA polymerase sigma factor n=1 Tax=Thalassotalea crassostreae TaxID=1763536 RepID=UPI00083835AD|nr:sigma-70 family RNA polymerase sigma factor [Thalassotalea crassostreae]
MLQSQSPTLHSSEKPINTRVMNTNNDVDHQQLANWLKSVAENRDKQAFTCLFKFFAGRIQNIASKKYNNPSLASEIVQETMTNVWRKAHLFNAEKGAPTTWVYTVMRNASFDLMRKIQSTKEDNYSDDIWPMVESADVEEHQFEDHFENKHIEKYLDKLPENQRQVVKGFYFLEMSQEQLAEHLGLPLGTVKSRLRLALSKLKEQMQSKLGEQHD